MQDMKILIDARFYGLEHAGLGRYTMNLVKELAKLDHENEYILLLRKKYFQNLHLPKNWKKAVLNAKHYSIGEQANLPLVIRKYKPDVVHFLHSNIPIFYRGKFVVTIHDMTMYNQGIDATTLPLPLYFAKRIPFKMVFRKAVYDSQAIIVPSNAVKDEIVEYFKIPKAKVEVTYEGVENKEQRTPKTEKILGRYDLNGKKYFLYVGNVYPHKNVKRAIEAIVGLHEEPIHFVIVSGHGVFRHRLEKQVKKLKAQEYVKILDFIPDEELSVLYANSLAFIFPSLSEGFGLPGLEAMQSGTIVLSSKIPVFREIYKDKVLYFDPKNVESIKKAMQKVLQMNNVERKKMITNGKKLAKEYSWEKMARETLEVYKGLLRS
jgi:glycosyltransferase involved in cell wall biosynthesis